MTDPTPAPSASSQPPITADLAVRLRERLAGIDTTAISDRAGLTRVVTSAITLRSATAGVCAPAYPVRARRDFFPAAWAVEHAPPGSVIVLDGGGEEFAYAGEIIARGALARGLAGIVVDGGFRDIGYISGCELPVYSRWITPFSRSGTESGEYGVPVTCGGVTVNPGDLVIADAEGMIVLDPAQAEAAIEGAHEVKAAEQRVLDRLAAGATLSQVVALDEHAAALRAGVSHKLGFSV